MTFGQAIKNVFANLKNFRGRARRAEFWWFYLFIALVSISVSIAASFVVAAIIAPMVADLDANANGDMLSPEGQRLFGTFVAVIGLGFVFGLLIFAMTLAVWVRRLHDVGQSGHWLWLSLVGLSIVPLIMVMMDGQPRDNQYGPDPKAAERTGMGQWAQQPPGVGSPPS